MPLSQITIRVEASVYTLRAQAVLLYSHNTLPNESVPSVNFLYRYLNCSVVHAGIEQLLVHLSCDAWPPFAWAKSSDSSQLSCSVDKGDQEGVRARRMQRRSACVRCLFIYFALRRRRFSYYNVHNFHRKSRNVVLRFDLRGWRVPERGIFSLIKDQPSPFLM
jgi:hypothetical protein